MPPINPNSVRSVILRCGCKSCGYCEESFCGDSILMVIYIRRIRWWMPWLGVQGIRTTWRNGLTAAISCFQSKAGLVEYHYSIANQLHDHSCGIPKGWHSVHEFMDLWHRGWKSGDKYYVSVAVDALSELLTWYFFFLFSFFCESHMDCVRVYRMLYKVKSIPFSFPLQPPNQIILSSEAIQWHAGHPYAYYIGLYRVLKALIRYWVHATNLESMSGVGWSNIHQSCDDSREEFSGINVLNLTQLRAWKMKLCDR